MTRLTKPGEVRLEKLQYVIARMPTYKSSAETERGKGLGPEKRERKNRKNKSINWRSRFPYLSTLPLIFFPFPQKSPVH